MFRKGDTDLVDAFNAELEAAEFARQSREFAERLKAPTLVGSGMNHFEIIETLADPGSPLGSAALSMLA